jgi:hypothetical protein
METITVATLKTQVREAANMENSLFVSDAELLRYIDLSYAELYDLLVEAFENYYTLGPIAETVTTGNIIPYPADFYKLVGLDMNFGGSFYPLKSFEFAERGRWVNANKLAYVGIINAAYKLMGTGIVLYPESSAAGTYRYWYIPRRTSLVGDSSTVDGVNGWQQFIVIDAAIKCLQKEESDVAALMAEKGQIISRIQAMARKRDAGSPRKISDVTNNYMGFSYGGGIYGR